MIFRRITAKRSKCRVSKNNFNVRAAILILLQLFVEIALKRIIFSEKVLNQESKNYYDNKIINGHRRLYSIRNAGSPKNYNIRD